MHAAPAALPRPTGNPPLETTEEEQIKMLMRNMARILRMVIGLTDAADNDSSNEDGYRDDVRKYVVNDTF